MVEDAKTAVRFLRANAEKLGIDPNHIAVMGESAGGYLAAMVGTPAAIRNSTRESIQIKAAMCRRLVDLYACPI